MAVAYGSLPIVRVGSKAAAIFMRDARLALSYRASFILTLAGVGISVVVAHFISLAAGKHPSLQLEAGMTYFDYLAINLAFVRYQSTALISFAEVIRDSQTAATLEVTLATPTGLPTLVLSAGLWAFTFTSLQTIVYLFCATFFGLSLSHMNLATLALVLFLTIVCSSPLGVLAAAMAVRYNKTGPIDFFVATTTTVFGGIYIPLTALPLFMQWCGWALPITHALAGLRAALRGDSIFQASGDIVWLAAATAILLPLSLNVFAAAVKHAKVNGTLGQY
jgi:ABC-2 type transport system permease protein